MTKNNSPANDPVFLWRCIRTYADYALEQLEQGAVVTAETLREIQLAKEQTGAALFALLNDNPQEDK